MNNNIQQEKLKSHTAIKIVSLTLCVIVIVSLIFNVYQFNVNSTLRSDIAALQSEIETLETDRDTLNKEIESKQTEASDLAQQIEDLNNSIETLKADNQSLLDSLRTLDDGINSTHTDVELSEDEYKGDTGVDALNAQYNDLSPEKKAEVDAALERAKKKHPEWFTDDSAGNTNTGEGNYEHVGTPDNTENTRQIEFGESGHVEGGENMTAY